MNNDKRISWEEYFIKITKLVSEKSSCLSAPKGAIIIKDKRIIATGYSGAPAGIVSCYEKGYCLKRRLGYGHGEGHHECKAVHAEANAILNAAKTGVSTNDCMMYCTHKPCEECAKMIIQSGIKVVYYCKEYESKFAKELFEESNVELVKLEV